MINFILGFISAVVLIVLYIMLTWWASEDTVDHEWDSEYKARFADYLEKRHRGDNDTFL